MLRTLVSRTLLGVCASLLTVLPATAVTCVEPSFLAVLAEGLAAAERPSPDMVERVLADQRRAVSTDRCGFWNQERGAFQLNEGQYWVWRNNFADYWFPVDPRNAERVGNQLAALSSLLEKIYPDGDYTDVTFYPFKASGITFVPPGFQDGQAGLQEMERFREELTNLAARPPEIPGTVAERLALLTELKAEIVELQRELVEGQGKSLPPAMQDGEVSSSEAGAESDSQGEEGRESTPGKKKKDGGGRSERDGSGGILPSGAPPWLTDILRLVLTYFGVDKIVEAAALAVYLLQPELLEQLAAFSGALTDGLECETLDEVMAAAREIYALYNSVSGMVENLGDAKTFKQAVEAVADAIDEMPEKMRRDLSEAMGGNLAKHLGQIADLSEVVTEFDLEDLTAGELFSDEAQQQIRRKIVDEVERRATEELLRVVGDVGLPGVSGEAALRLLEGESLAAADLATAALLHTAAQHTGLTSAELAVVFEGDFESVAEQRARRYAEGLWNDLGLPDPATTAEDLSALAALEQGDWREATGRAMARLPAAQRQQAEALLEGLAADPEAALRDQGQRLLQEVAGLDDAVAAAVVQGQPLPEIARRHAEHLAGRSIDWQNPTEEAMRLAAEALARQDPRFADLPRLPGFSAGELRGEVLRAAESHLTVAVETHTGILVRRVRQALPPAVTRALESGKRVEDAAGAYLAEVRGAVEARWQGEARHKVRQALVAALPKPLRPSDVVQTALMNVEEEDKFLAKLTAWLSRRVAETLRPAALGWAPQDPPSGEPPSGEPAPLLRQLAEQQIRRTLAAKGAGEAIPEEALSAWLDGRFEEGTRHLVNAHRPAVEAELRQVTAVARELADGDPTAVLERLTAPLWDRLDEPWPAYGPRLLSGEPAADVLEPLLSRELERQNLPPVALAGWPDEVEACPQDPPSTLPVGGDGEPLFCDLRGVRAWLAKVLAAQLRRHLPEQKLLSPADVDEILAGRGAEVARRKVQRHLCPDTPPPAPCSLREQVKAHRQGLSSALLDLAADGVFVVAEDQAKLLLAGDTQAVAALWQTAAQERVEAALARSGDGAATPLAQLRQGVQEIRTAAKAEAGAASEAGRAVVAPLAHPVEVRRRQHTELRRIELGQRLRECVARGLLPAGGGGTNEDPIARCRELIQPGGGP